MSVSPSTFQSRWGFHPCDYSTFRKLKVLNILYLKALRQAHAWQRWKRKDPQNRVIRLRIRNERGQTIGYESAGPRPEPPLCPLFSRKTLEKRFVDKKGVCYKDGFMDETVVMSELPIAADYISARKPIARAEDVRPLRLTSQEIDDLFIKAQAWIEGQDVK